MVGGVTNQVAILVGLSWLGSDRFEILYGEPQFSQFFGS